MNPAEQALTSALVRLASEGRRPPCGDWRQDNPWVSDDPQRRAQAAGWCHGCPVLAECGAAADEAGTVDFVWGGVDRTAPARRR